MALIKISALSALGSASGADVIPIVSGGTTYKITKTAFLSDIQTDINTRAVKSNNLSDLTNVSTARTNLGLGSGDSPTLTGLNLSGLTASQILATDGSKNIQSLTTATYPSLTELAYLKGVTSAIQTQFDAKVDDGAVTTSGLTMTTNRVLGRTTASTGAIEELSNLDTFITDASTSAKGKVELAIDTEVTTGTDATRAVTPDALAGSTIFGRKTVSVQVFNGTSDVTTGDGKAYITIPEALNGMNLVRAQATVVTAGTTNATTIMIHNKTDAQDMLSGAISIASAGTVGTVGTINTTYDDVATNDVLRIDVDSVSTTAPKGLMVVLEFQLP